eukprot:PhF_6_TR28979/c0_g1_i1/m.42245/K17790/TIM22; mitochondrial import inner membrane translocase subunit TIM22
MLTEGQPPFDPMQEGLLLVRESTLSAGAAGLAGGYVMGTGFSFFHSMITAETTTQCMGMKDYLRYSFRTAHRSGCNFASFGVFFGALEVALEKRRGAKDMWNPACSGGLMGGYYGWRSYRHMGLAGGVVGGAILTILFEKMVAYMTGTPMHPTY